MATRVAPESIATHNVVAFKMSILMEIKMEEIWKDIKGYEGIYQVSNKGNVKSLKRIVKTWNAYKTLYDRLLKAHASKTVIYMLF